MQIVQSKVDNKGRITLPKSMRNEINLTEGDVVDITLNLGSLVVKPSPPRCIFCNQVTKNKILNRSVCPDCVVEFNKR